MASTSLVTMAEGNGAMDGVNTDGVASPIVRSKAMQKAILRAAMVARIRRQSGMGEPNVLTPSGSGNPYMKAYQNLAPSLQVGG